MSSQTEQLRQAAATGNLEQVRALLKTGAKTEPDLEGRTALHLASANGHETVVKALLEGGAKINALDAAGYSPLHQAATEGHEEVVKTLIKNGCHVDTQDELHGNTALHEAAWKGYSRTLEILCKHGANVYIKNNGGFTPLHLACQNGHNQCCRVLLLAACKPDVRNSYGDAPLHTAARYGHAGVLRILISAFCNVNEKNKNGDTALHISAAMGRNKLTRILLEAGSDQKIKNNQGETARDIAERKEFKEVVKLMDNPPVTVIHVEEQSKKPSKSSKKRDKDSGTSQESAVKEKKDKHKKSKKHHKVHFSDKEKKGNVSPYGCHMFPDASHFPTIKLKSLPQEPLKNGEQYYADLAGNIKKGPRGLGYMCYCAPFFNHVEKKLDANKKELLDHIDSRNEDLKAKITHLEQRTHDQLFSLNQKMKESLALERGECAERIDRRLFRERRELEQHQENCAKLIQSEMKSLLSEAQNGHSGSNGHCKNFMPNGNLNHHAHNSNYLLTRSKSEDMLSETNSNHNSVSMLSSTVTGVSRFTNNSNYNKLYLSPAQCGTKPKGGNHMPNISRLKMRCMGYPELKRESRSEGDLTSCHTDRTDYNSNTSISVANSNLMKQHFIDLKDNQRGQLYANVSKKSQPHETSYKLPSTSGALWRNTSYGQSHDRTETQLEQYESKTPGFLPDASKSKGNYPKMKSSYCTNHNQDRPFSVDSKQGEFKSQIRTVSNGILSAQKDISSHSTNHNVRVDDGNTILPSIDNDGSSFV